MGNSFGCSASGERLVSAARDGDLVEAKMLLDCNPCLARYSTFGGLNSPLHFASAKAHNEIVALLLENGADVNCRNYCGQTALMQACRYGHWEVVQTLLLFKCNVTRADYLSGRTALHFAAVNGHVRCIRLVLADFIPSSPIELINAETNDERGNGSNNRPKHDQSALAKFVNKAADGGITALHMAGLNGYFDCVQLLLNLRANVSAVTFNYGASMDLIGAGSTPLHYAACGGNLKCCQILLASGGSRLTLNCNGWLPLDVARMWGRHWLEPLLAPNSELIVPVFPTSNYLSLPLMSVLNIASNLFKEGVSINKLNLSRCGKAGWDVDIKDDRVIIAYVLHALSLNSLKFILQYEEEIMVKANHRAAARGDITFDLAFWQEFSLQCSVSSEDTDLCAVCLERACTVAAEGCGHELCVRCALYLCSTCNITSDLLGPPGAIPCPLCRHGIISFTKLPGPPAKETKLHTSLGLCTPCMLHTRESEQCTPACTPEIRKNRVASVSSEMFCPVTCSPFPSVGIPLCTCSEGTCPSFEPGDGETQVESPRSQPELIDHDKMSGERLGKTSCSNMFWSRRSCSREQQCNSEINA